MYGAQGPVHADDATGIEDAAKANAADTFAQLTVDPTIDTDGEGNEYMTVTCSYTFRTITSYPMLPNAVVITRSATARIMQDPSVAPSDDGAAEAAATTATDRRFIGERR